MPSRRATYNPLQGEKGPTIRSSKSPYAVSTDILFTGFTVLYPSYLYVTCASHDVEVLQTFSNRASKNKAAHVLCPKGAQSYMLPRRILQQEEGYCADDSTKQSVSKNASDTA